MLFTGLGGLRPTTFDGTECPEGKTETMDDEVFEGLDENLLSPINSSQLNSPLLSSSIQQPPNQKFSIAQSKQPSNIAENKWETIETTVVYDNGSKETILTSKVASIEVFTNDESCSDRCWECIENMFLRMICCRTSIKTAEIYKNMSNVFLKVDHVASRVFPLTFLIINIAYWSSYLYIMD